MFDAMLWGLLVLSALFVYPMFIGMAQGVMDVGDSKMGRALSLLGPFVVFYWITIVVAMNVAMKGYEIGKGIGETINNLLY